MSLVVIAILALSSSGQTYTTIYTTICTGTTTFQGAAVVTVTSTISTLCTTMVYGKNPIKHVIVIMQENRAFDNYFGTYPGALGFPSNICIPYNPNSSSTPCASPFPLTTPVVTDMPHVWQAAQVDYNNAQMNGFLVPVSSSTLNCAEPMGYYNNATIPYYWYWASHYVLGDHMFESVLSYSQPNHWYAIAANAPVPSIYYTMDRNTPTNIKQTYLNQAQTITTLGDEMNQAGVSWKYYDSPVYNTTTGKQLGNKFAYWNPYLAKNSTYTQPYYTHFDYRGQIINDISSGNLPSVSMVIPSAPISDHAPANITLGQYWVTDVIDSVQNSQYWNSTAILVSWDDWGGYFDQVVPPKVDAYGLGFRVPLIVVSAYAKPGYIDSTVYSFESFMKFTETIFGLPSLTARDANSNNMLGMFNFNQLPQPPKPYPLTQVQLNAIAPYLFVKSAGVVNPYGAGCGYASPPIAGPTNGTISNAGYYSGYLNGDQD